MDHTGNFERVLARAGGSAAFVGSTDNNVATGFGKGDLLTLESTGACFRQCRGANLGMAYLRDFSVGG